jgi:phenylacetyl-CoA:acceptor oxidoreductase subunit 2
MIGAAPRLQQSWDWRAAGNFIFGGAGSGVIAFTVLAGSEGLAASLLFVVGLALVVCGLTCVWFEIGRPLRALHVVLHPRRSWMSREAIVAGVLFPVAIAAALGVERCRIPAAVLALAFLFCQTRIVQRARGIAAWREPFVVPLLFSTGLVEGGGLFFAVDRWLAQGTRTLLVLFAALVLLRLVAWLLYRRRVARSASPRAVAALDQAGRWLQFAGTLPLLLVVALTATLTGSWMKFVLVTRAGFHEGFRLPQWPVRGAR